MLIRVVDFETTGLDPKEGGICEVGWTDVSEGVAGTTHSVLCDPGCPISLEAMAVHHIRNEDVANAEPWHKVLGHPDIGVDCYAAHNAEFEQGFWSGRPEGVPWICTYKVALRTHPEAERHTNQYLRYYLGLPVEDERALPAHRAGPDTYVTALLLVELMKYASVEDMIRWSSGPALLPRVPFGKFYGRPWSDVDTPYLKWIILSSDRDATVKANARHELRRRESD